MAHIDVHRIESIAARRAARTAQVEALAPFPGRDALDPWNPRRRAYTHRVPFALIARAEDLELGETIPSAETPEQQIARTITATTARRAAAQSAPDQVSYVLHIDDTLDSSEMLAVSTDAIPWPFRIVGAVHTRDTAPNDIFQWNVYVTDTPLRGIIGAREDMVSGAPLIRVRSHRNAQSLWSVAGEQRGVVASRVDGADQSPQLAAASQLIGSTVHEAGRYLAYVVHPGATFNPNGSQLVITLQQTDALPLAESFAPPPASARPPAARVTTTTRGPLPPQQRPPPPPPAGAWNLPPTGITPIFGFEARRETTSPPSLARAMQLALEGRAAVTTPYRIGPGDFAVASGQTGFETLRQAEQRRALERR